MPANWCFATDPETGFIEMIARAEGSDGSVGDARDVWRPGDASVRTPKLTYDVLAKAGAGTLVIAEDHTFQIIARKHDGSPARSDDASHALSQPTLLASPGIKPKA